MVDFITPLIMIVIIAVLTVVINGWIANSDRSFFDLTVKIPKFVDKPDAQLSDYEPSTSTSDNKPGMIQTYHQLRFIAIFVMAGAFILGMMLFLGEEFGISKKGQAIALISNTLIYTIFLVVFPILWDALAVGLESLNVYILNPANPTPDMAAARAKDVFMRVGGFTTDAPPADALLKAGAAIFVGNFGPITQFFHDSFTSVFRAFLAGMVFLMMYVIGTMRIVLTATIITGLPMILALKLVPKFNKVSDKLLDTLVGLVVATVISSIVIVAGGAYLDTLPHDTIDQNFQRWIASMAVVILAIFMPVMLSPMLGSIVSSVTGMVTTALAAGAVAGSATVAGAAKGAAGGLNSLMSGVGGGLGGAGASGLTQGLASRIASGGLDPIGKIQRMSSDIASPIMASAAPSTATSAAMPSASDAPFIPQVTSPSFLQAPIPASTSKPVIASAPRPMTLGGSDVPTHLKQDLSTLDSSANSPIDKSAGFSALAVQPSSEIFTPVSTPVSFGDKFSAIMKGAAIGGSTGLVHGLTKGVSMSIGSAGHGTGSLSQILDVPKMVHNVEAPHAEVEKVWEHAKRMMFDRSK